MFLIIICILLSKIIINTLKAVGALSIGSLPQVWILFSTLLLCSITKSLFLWFLSLFSPCYCTSSHQNQNYTINTFNNGLFLYSMQPHTSICF